MTLDDYGLLKILADGASHSGERLAEQLNITRAAIWKRIHKLNQIPGIDICSSPGKGYQLQQRLELLDPDTIQQMIPVEHRQCLPDLYVLPVVSSTNDFLLDFPAPATHQGRACTAEYQTSGRGRRGRQWVSRFGKNIYLSLAWNFDLPLGSLAGLSIAMGVSVVQILSGYGVTALGLKWPNDIHVEGKKIAGILVEAKGEMDGPTHAVIGVGLNLDLSADDGKQIDQPWVDLASCISDMPNRNELIGELLNALIDTCIKYQHGGLNAFLSEWEQYDIYKGQAVELVMADQTQKGIYLGLNEQGALVLQQEKGKSIWFSGEVSLRATD